MFLLPVFIAAQDPPRAAEFANRVRADLELLRVHQTLGAWQKSHAADSTKLAGYESDRFGAFPRELTRRCAVASGDPLPRISRAAMFLVPDATPGKLPPLPAKDDPALVSECALEQMSFTAMAPELRDPVVRMLSSEWGAPTLSPEDADFWVRLADPNTIGWHMPGMSVWAISTPVRIDPTLPIAYPATFTIFARSEMPAERDWYESISWLEKRAADESAAEMAKLANLDPHLTTQILAGCEAMRSANRAQAASRLEAWLNAARNLPRARRAAALMLADRFAACNAQSDPKFEALGVIFDGGCPQDADYGHTFRKQAEQIDPEGLAGRCAALGEFWDKCRIAYGDIDSAAQQLADAFPEWRPTVHYALARNHGVRLSLAYPGGNPEEGLFGFKEQPPGLIERERAATIRYLTLFLKEAPEDPEAAFAWQEIWRLRAGLKPTRVWFGCSCE